MESQQAYYKFSAVMGNLFYCYLSSHSAGKLYNKPYIVI